MGKYIRQTDNAHLMYDTIMGHRPGVTYANEAAKDKLKYTKNNTPLIYKVNIPSGGKSGVNVVPVELRDVHQGMVQSLKAICSQVGISTLNQLTTAYSDAQSSIADGSWISNYVNLDPEWESISDVTTLRQTVSSALSTEQGRSQYLISTGTVGRLLSWIKEYYTSEGISKLIEFVVNPSQEVFCECYYLQMMMDGFASKNVSMTDTTITLPQYGDLSGETVLATEVVPVRNLRSFFHYSSNADDYNCQYLSGFFGGCSSSWVTLETTEELLQKSYDYVWNLGADIYGYISDRKSNCNSPVAKMFVDGELVDGVQYTMNLEEGEHTIVLAADGNLKTNQLSLDVTTTEVTLPESFTTIPVFAFPGLTKITAGPKIDSIQYAAGWANVSQSLVIDCPNIVQDNGIFIVNGTQSLSLETVPRISTLATTYDGNMKFPKAASNTTLNNYVFGNQKVFTNNPFECFNFTGTLEIGDGCNASWSTSESLPPFHAVSGANITQLTIRNNSVVYASEFGFCYDDPTPIPVLKVRAELVNWYRNNAENYWYTTVEAI